MNQCVCTYAKALHLERSQYLSTDAWRFIKELTEQKQATLMFLFLFFLPGLSSRVYKVTSVIHCNGEIIQQHTYNSLLSSCRTFVC